MSPVPSLDPSSTTMTSKSGHHRHSRVWVERHCSQRVQCSGHAQREFSPRLENVQIVLNLQCGQVEHLLLRTDEVQLHPCRELLEGGGHRRIHPVKYHTDSQGCSLSLVLLAVWLLQSCYNKYLEFFISWQWGHQRSPIGLLQLDYSTYSNWVIPPSFTRLFHPRTTIAALRPLKVTKK